MDEERRTASGPAVGGSSLLVIFAVLCLTIFALLALGTVQADGRLSDASASAVTGYYDADCAAEELLARIRNGELPEGVTVSREVVMLEGDPAPRETEREVYSYACPISETQTLLVEVLVDGTDWRVHRWQAVSTADWQADETLDLWDGDPVIDLGP